MKSVLPVILISCLSFSFCAGSGEIDPAAYAPVAERLRVDGLRDEKAYILLADLLRASGPRLTGSPGAAAAVEHMRRLMESLGFETWLEPTTVEHWVRGGEEAAIVGRSKSGDLPLAISALGGSVPTPAAGLTAPAIEAASFEELERLGPAVSGKIVFFNHPMDRTRLETFRAYGEAVQYRSMGAARAARQGAVAVLVRSATLRIDEHPHTGLMHYESGTPEIPAAALSTRDAEILSARLKEDPSLRIRLRLDCGFREPVLTANVVGQIRGTEKPEEVILVGGHLDSWDLSVGAHDDGAGCLQAVEALRLIKEAGLKPRRTIRAVMFMNEEYGGTGGRDYAADPRRRSEKHLVAMESDRGGFLPLAFAVGGPPQVAQKFARCAELLKGLGLSGIQAGGGGVDIAAIVEQGAVPMGFVPDSQIYFDLHHSALDTLDKVHPREIELGAISLSLMAYIVSQEGL